MSPSDREELSPLKQAIVSLRRMKERIADLERERSEPIAVVGIGCRFPGDVDGPDAFWQFLCEGGDGIVETPSDRWDVDAFYDPDPETPGRMSAKHGGYLGRVDGFDADFFRISPRELVSMDPQQRLLLEVSWEALENGGLDPTRLAGSRTGVFFGIGTFDYPQLIHRAAGRDRVDAYAATGAGHSLASGRLSYLLGLQGPSLSVDTACSASLVSVHLACQSLHGNECRVALAGGVNLILIPDVSIALSKAHMLSGDGRCRAFDGAASGFSRGEGCGVVVLKRLSHAIEDRDRVLAVISGSAVNQDGRSSGLTAPNGKAQEAVIREALDRAGVEPAAVGYVEAHGTGTSLGDPIEARALGAVMARGREMDRPLAVGSVKTNIGHLEAAAGVAGLIKTVLAVQRGEIPPHLHLNEPNPLIPWDELPLRVVTEREPWPGWTERRVAGISSFGFSGTNAHVVVTQAPDVPASHAGVDRPIHLFTASARSRTALDALLARHLADLRGTPEALPDICFTANSGRAALEHRLALQAGTTDELITQLEELVLDPTTGHGFTGYVPPGPTPDVAFLFTGQGSQHTGMGRELFETQPTFRRCLERCADLLAGELDVPLLDLLFRGEHAELLDQTTYAQPGLFAIEIALAELWRSWGIVPTAVMGHSVGELAAACTAGVFSLPDGLRLISARGRLMGALPPGGVMAAVFAPPSQVEEVIDRAGGSVTIAAFNAPTEVVISGPEADVRRVAGELESGGSTARILRVSNAFHSALVEPMLPEFEAVLRDVTLEPPQTAMVSNVTGRLVGDEVASPDYWLAHLRSPVQFAEGLTSLREMGYAHFVEVGPRAVLSGLGAKCVEDPGVHWLPSLRQADEWPQILTSLSRLYTSGADVDWEGFDRDYPRRRVALPTYPFERSRYWIDGVHTDRPSDPVEPRQAWEGIRASARAAADLVPIDMRLDTYGERMGRLDRLAVAHMAGSLARLGAFRRPGEFHTVQSLLRDFNVEPTYERLLGRWLATLVDAGHLHRQDDAYSCTRPLAEDGIGPARTEAADVLGDDHFLLEYMDRCSARMVDVLTGRENALETLFPGGSMETAVALYRDWAPARYFNQIARSTVEALVRSTPPGRPLRLLEIGAGTGSTTASLLPVLPPDRTTYWFTDASEFFFRRAQGVLGAYPFVRYGVLDIEVDPGDQGYGSGQFDAVVAGNVLHATRDLEVTLANTASLLAPGGVLILLETTDHPSWLDVTTGLIEGWQQFEDAIRRDNPLVSPDAWERALKNAGFADTCALPAPESAAAVLPNHLILATRVDAQQGVVEMRREASPADRAARPDPVPTPGRNGALMDRLGSATPAERDRILVDWIRSHLNRILRRDGERTIGRTDRLFDLGMDSLMAVEFRNEIGTGLPLTEPLPATLVFDHPTVDAIARYVGARLELGGPDRPQEPAPDREARRSATEPPVATPELEGMTDEEVEAMLTRKLDSL